MRRIWRRRGLIMAVGLPIAALLLWSGTVLEAALALFIVLAIIVGLVEDERRQL